MPLIKKLCNFESYFYYTRSIIFIIQRFIRNAVSFLKEYGFDGLDVDWEFPVFSDGPSNQKYQLSDFLMEFKNYTQSLQSNDTGSDLILSAAVPATKYIVDIGFDILGIAR